MLETKRRSCTFKTLKTRQRGERVVSLVKQSFRPFGVLRGTAVRVDKGLTSERLLGKSRQLRKVRREPRLLLLPGRRRNAGRKQGRLIIFKAATGPEENDLGPTAASQGGPGHDCKVLKIASKGPTSQKD